MLSLKEHCYYLTKLITSATLFVNIGIYMGGCSPFQSGVATNYVPAVRNNISTLSQNELQQIIARSLGVATVNISKNVFTKKHTASIEKAHLLGFDLAEPTVFILLTNKKRCILKNQKTNKKYPLIKTHCRTL